jgi:glycine/D-amino acid oxidase-like deaminating enzyme
VLEGVLVNDVSRRKGRMVCATDEGEIQAEMVVYATHTDSRRFSSFLGDEIVPIRGQGMLVEPGPPVYRGSFSTHWKLNVWRSDAQGRLHLGGWRHDAWDRSYWKMRPELDDHLQENLQGWFQSTFPEAGHLSVARRWSGIFGWTADYLPLVGPLPGRVGELVIAGFSGGGLPFAFEAGRVIEAIVSEKEPVPGGGLLNPRRFT